VADRPALEGSGADEPQTRGTTDMVDQAALSLAVDGDGVAWLVFDRPQSQVNLLTTGVMLRLDELLGEIEVQAAGGRIKVLVVRSAKPDNFIAGADVDEIAGIADAADGAAKALAGQNILRRLEQLPIPTIAMIDGSCMGGGTELALACAFRVASDREQTRIGLPEIRLGIVPGFGGTVRLPRLVGLRAATELILSGRAISSRRALDLGLVDERVPAPILEERVHRLAWDRIDDGKARHPPRRRLPRRLLDDTAPGRRLVIWQARKRVLRQTRGHYPAPLEALKLLRSTLALPLDEAFRREAQALGRLVVSPECRELVHVFKLMERARKPPPGPPPLPVERVMVLGAGTMGGGIAQLLASRDISVRLLDVRADALSVALQHARALFDRAAARRRMSRRAAAHRVQRISPTLDYDGLGNIDLVIEAVVEQIAVKQEVLARVEAGTRPNCVVASNTSSLSISRMQSSMSRPQAFCGMHFFNPVERMPLVEIVRGDASGDESIATVFALARRLDKVAVIVRDGPGFLVNRILAPYLNEAGWLLADGAAIGEVDTALEDFGMPMGPLRLLDEIGLDVARHVAVTLFEAFGERLRPAPPLAALAVDRRPGRKGGRGFYIHAQGRRPQPDPELYAELGASVPAVRRPLSPESIRERAILAMINEAARALEDGIVHQPGELDLALITGTGFPPFRGGLLRYADQLGLPVVLDRLRSLANEVGPRFAPAPLIQERGEAGTGFYDSAAATP
jgi:3-hydroxyacyl-CoA dehydrogenase/enoyl-CoA hydratase/3-hydroxybutyryl-CoA epimerase